MGRESEKKRATRIYSLLRRNCGSIPRIFLKHGTKAQMLCAVMLSAQSTDKQTDRVTKTIFKKYKTVNDFAGANPKKFEQEIRSIGLYKSKAKNIVSAFRKIKKMFGGEIPGNMRDLVSLPGVGRKTANLVLASIGKIEGIAVDTHVARLAYRFGFTQSKNPSIIERDLMTLYPKNKWILINGLFISHGRAVCTARSPKCKECFLDSPSLCPRIGVK